MKIEKLNLKNFEVLTEDANGTLINGFSEAFEAFNDILIGGSNTFWCDTNVNCQSGKNYQPKLTPKPIPKDTIAHIVTNKNCGGNCIKGCKKH